MSEADSSPARTRGSDRKRFETVTGSFEGPQIR